MRQMIGHNIRRLAADDRRMNFGVEWLTPGQGGFVDVDITLAFVEFSHDLLHPDSIAATKKIPIGQFNRRGMGISRDKKRCETIDGLFHGGSSEERKVDFRI